MNDTDGAAPQADVATQQPASPVNSRPVEGAEQPVDPVAGTAVDPLHTPLVQALRHEADDRHHDMLIHMGEEGINGDFGRQEKTRGEETTAMSYPQHSSDIGAHPELAEMRERLERTASSGQAMAVEGLIILAGVYAAISPWVVHFTDEPNITINNLIVGIAVGLIGLGLTAVPERMFRLAWVLAPLGVWLVLSPWVVTAAHSADAGVIWNNCWIGAVVFVLGLAAAGMTIGVTRRGPRSQ